MERCVERRYDYGHCADGPCKEPRLELAPLGPGPLYYVAHYWVVEGIEHPCRHHYCGDRRKLGRRQSSCKEYESEYVVCEKLVYHVPSNGSDWVHCKVPFVLFRHISYSPPSVLYIVLFFRHYGDAIPAQHLVASAVLVYVV